MLKWLSKIFGRKDQIAESSPRKDDIEKLISTHQRRLQKLKEQQAISQKNIAQVPPHILIEIEDIEAEIQSLQTMLADENYKNKGMLKWLSKIFGRKDQIAESSPKVDISSRKDQTAKSSPGEDIPSRINQIPKSSARKDSIERLISTHKRRLQKLKEQQAISQQNIPQTPPEILIEIEDIEAEIQSLQTMLADENYKNKDEIEAKIMVYKQRLQKLKETGAQSLQQGSDKEIADIEAQIQRLQAELKGLDD